MADFLDRITYKNDLAILLKEVCVSFSLGNYSIHKIIEIGYEDLNLALTTSDATYFVKIFAAQRSFEDCQRYVEIITQSIDAGVQTPKLFSQANGTYLYDKSYDDGAVRLVVMEYVQGKTFFDMNRAPTDDELAEIAKQAALINMIDFRPTALYDGWSITQCEKVFDDNNKHLPSDDKALIEPLIEAYKRLDITALPHCLVHGDLIATNLLKSDSGPIYALDFAVTNYYPRIIELAVILSGYTWEEMSDQSVVLATYEQFVKLTSQEKELLPLFTKIAYAMHIMGAAGEKAKGNDTQENEYWWALGREGLNK